LEHNHTSEAGPPRPLHRNEDEWFYIVDCTYIVEAGPTMYTLHADDSVLGPRGISHAFALNGESAGRLLIPYAPAGPIEESLNSRAKELGGQTIYVSNAARIAAFGMELPGPPIVTS